MRLANKFMVFVGGGAVLLVLIITIFFTTQINSFIDTVNDYHQIIQEAVSKPDFTKEILMQREQEFKQLIDGEISFLINSMLVISLLALVIFLSLLVYISKKVVGPLNEAVEFSNSLARGDFSVNLQATSRDEIGVLVKSLNYMRNRLEHSISKLKVSHEREKQARKEAESANNIKSDFIANISHELKNPLNSILGICNLILKDLQNGIQDDDLEAKLRMVVSSSELLNELISSLLELSKLGKEDLSLNVADLNTSDFIRDVIDSAACIAERKSISINNHYSASMPSLMRTDKYLLMNTLKKLIANAIRVSVIGGSIDIGCDIEDQSIVFTIKDSANLDESSISLAEMFNKFIESSGDLDVVNQGLQGVVLLNLTIATANAQFLEASITGELDDSGNSVFKLILPIILHDRETQTADIKPTHTATNIMKIDRKKLSKQREIKDDGRVATATISPSEELGANILMAEDNEANRMLVELIFRRTNYHLECVDDGITCLEVLKRRKFDLLLLDLQMPRMDGYDVLKSLREDAKLKDLPVIILTAYMEEGEHDNILNAGANDYLLKPIDVDELLEKVRSFVG